MKKVKIETKNKKAPKAKKTATPKQKTDKELKQELKKELKQKRKEEKKQQKANKKERVIHTRVSEDLEQELRTNAAHLGVSVSNLVRNALLNAFGLVEGIVVDGARVAHTARGEAPPEAPTQAAAAPAAPQDDRIIGWQSITLNMNALCGKCNAILPKGDPAFVGVTQSNTKPIYCPTCVKEA